MKFRFDCSVVVEATSQEDALSKLAHSLSTRARAAGSGKIPAPFFTIIDVTSGKDEPKDLRIPPSPDRQKADAEAKARHDAALAARTSAPGPGTKES